jgi:hypothetical protein
MPRARHPNRNSDGIEDVERRLRRVHHGVPELVHVNVEASGVRLPGDAVEAGRLKQNPQHAR